MFHVKAFFYPQSFKGKGHVIGCVLFSTPHRHVAERVCQKLRRAAYYGYSPSRVLHFVHEE